MSKEKPNPGSVEALAAGCTCPVIDNNYGKGRLTGTGTGTGYGDERVFIYSMNCPVHYQKP